MSTIAGIGEVWKFTRFRLDQALDDLSDEQWRWRMHPSTHTIAEIALHIAGAEHYWWSRMSSPGAPELDAQLDRAVIDGFLEDHSFPYAASECTGELAKEKLELMRPRMKSLFADMTGEQETMSVISPIGDSVDCSGLARLAQHAGYHTGQIWMIRMHPSFP